MSATGKTLAAKYHETVSAQLDRILATQMAAIERAARACAESILAERWIWVFGTGHSHMLAEELFYRAGGLARVRPMLVAPLMLHESAHASTRVERDPSIVARLLADYPIAAGDVLIVASNSGRNSVPIELAIKARERGARVIALVNRSHSSEVPSRHASGAKLGDVAELVLDNCGVAGDACVSAGDLRVGAASTVTGAAILQMVACRAIEIGLEAGQAPEIFTSSNTDGDEHNDAIVRKYRGDIRHL